MTGRMRAIERQARRPTLDDYPSPDKSDSTSRLS
jgi:hypothetical protein